MNRRRFRWWHGMILGALVGIAAWQALALVDGSREPTKATGLSVRQFASIVTRPADTTSAIQPDGSRIALPTLSDVCVHPAADGKQLVTATLSGDDDEPSRAAELIAAVPFVYQPPTPRPTPQAASAANALSRLFGGPRVAAADLPTPPPKQTFPSVREFLAKAAPSLPVRYAWWEGTSLRTAASLGGPFVLLGMLLPFALQCLVWLGLLAPLPPPEPKPAKVAPEPPAKPKVDVDALAFANGQLDTLTEQMAENLAARPDDEAEPTLAPVTSPFEPTAASHPAPPLDPVAPTPAVDPTSFDGGVYYPVHRPKRGEA